MRTTPSRPYRRTLMGIEGKRPVGPRIVQGTPALALRARTSPLLAQLVRASVPPPRRSSLPPVAPLALAAPRATLAPSGPLPTTRRSEEATLPLGSREGVVKAEPFVVDRKPIAAAAEVAPKKLLSAGLTPTAPSPQASIPPVASRATADVLNIPLIARADLLAAPVITMTGGPSLFGKHVRAIRRMRDKHIGPILWTVVVLGLATAFVLGHLIGARHAGAIRVGSVTGVEPRDFTPREEATRTGARSSAVMELD